MVLSTPSGTCSQPLLHLVGTKCTEWKVKLHGHFHILFPFPFPYIKDQFVLEMTIFKRRLSETAQSGRPIVVRLSSVVTRQWPRYTVLHNANEWRLIHEVCNTALSTCKNWIPSKLHPTTDFGQDCASNLMHRYLSSRKIEQFSWAMVWSLEKSGITFSSLPHPVWLRNGFVRLTNYLNNLRKVWLILKKSWNH